tara:strand:+ start:1092 stop:2423 length:1332 start_codon:yes stop_codon:yes gene_type:complete
MSNKLNSKPKKSKRLNLKYSNEAWKNALKFIPGGVQTFSKMPLQHGDGVAPKFIKKSKGCYTWDIDNNKYVDYICSLGPIILGYADKAVDTSAKKMIDSGQLIPSLPNKIETDLSKILVQNIPSAEMVRFGKNGSDVTQAAIRAARGLTGKNKVAACGYHGYHDWFIGTTSRNLGVPKEVRNLTKIFKYNDIDSLYHLFKKNKSEIAAVIMEPVNFVNPKDDFLNKVKDLTHANKAILIFDEIITGFRASLGGAQKIFNVTPDLSCFGKAMANGYPISAVVGKKEFMEIFNEVFFSSTFGGEAISIAASMTTIKEIKKRNTIKKINDLGLELIKNFRESIHTYNLNQHVSITGFGWWPKYTFYDRNMKQSFELQTLFQQEIVKRGILTRAGIFITDSHTKKIIEKTSEIFDETLYFISNCIKNKSINKNIEGSLIQPVMRESK